MNRLTKTLEPPRPVKSKVNREQWEMIEGELKLQLPDDYKEFISLYGAGWINDYIFVLTPILPDNCYNLKLQSEWLISNYSDLQQNTPEFYKHSLLPQLGGLFPCANAGGGQVIYWLTEGKANDWPIVVYGSGGAFEQFNMSLTSFIVGILMGELHCFNLPDDLTEDPPEFEFEEGEGILEDYRNI